MSHARTTSRVRGPPIVAARSGGDQALVLLPGAEPVRATAHHEVPLAPPPTPGVHPKPGGGPRLPARVDANDGRLSTRSLQRAGAWTEVERLNLGWCRPHLRRERLCGVLRPSQHRGRRSRPTHGSELPRLDRHAGFEPAISVGKSHYPRRRPRGWVAGPASTSPSTSKRDPWHGQSQLRSAALKCTRQPRWVQRSETAWTAPLSSR